jgi:hypothetical protein
MFVLPSSLRQQLYEISYLDLISKKNGKFVKKFNPTYQLNLPSLSSAS